MISACSILHPQQWPVGQRLISLTFDDGPNAKDQVSERLLDVLAKHGVKATFCYIGKNVEDNPSIARRAYEEGHKLAVHTYTHSLPTLLFSDTLDQEITRTIQVFRDATGNQMLDVPLFRPPLGIKTPAVIKSVRRAGLRYAYLTFFVNDVSATSANWRSKLDKIKQLISKHRGAAI